MRIEDIPESEYQRGKSLRYRKKDFKDIREKMKDLEVGEKFTATFSDNVKTRNQDAYNTAKALKAYERKYPRKEKFEIFHISSEKRIFIKRIT